MASPSADDTAEASVTETTKIRQGEHTCWRCRFFNDACRSYHQDLHMVFDGKALMLSGERRRFSRYKSIEHGEILERHCKVINDLSSTSPTNNRELSYSHLFRTRASLDHRPSALFSNVFASLLVVLVRRLFFRAVTWHQRLIRDSRMCGGGMHRTSSIQEIKFVHHQSEGIQRQDAELEEVTKIPNVSPSRRSTSCILSCEFVFCHQPSQCHTNIRIRARRWKRLVV